MMFHNAMMTMSKPMNKNHSPAVISTENGSLAHALNFCHIAFYLFGGRRTPVTVLTSVRALRGLATAISSPAETTRRPRC